ncbi:MAG: alanine racemase [Tissierellia bacterium]|nr:alanine racemase [Tissierellia bacterium]
MKLSRPVWMEIDHQQVRDNLEMIKKALKPATDLRLVLKDDAYSCGALAIGRTGWDFGIRNYAVSNMEEALELRQALPKANILVLGYTGEDMFEEALSHDISLALWNRPMAERLNQEALSQGKKAGIQLVVDTGLSRLGFLPDQASLEEIKAIVALEGLRLEGVYSHFARTETEDDQFSLDQIQTFKDFTQALEDMGIGPIFRHMSDSAGIIKFGEAGLEGVRSGALPIGSMTGRHVLKEDKKFPLKSAMSLYCRIARVQDFPAGRSVSYDGTFEAQAPIRVVTLPLGYGDGLPYALAGKMEVLIGGQRCRQIGAMNMDMIMVDATGVFCQQGDTVVLLGRQGQEEITLDDWSLWGGKSSTFFQAMLRDRIPKRHINL